LVSDHELISSGKFDIKLSKTDHKMSLRDVQSPSRGFFRDQDRLIIIWFITDGGSKKDFGLFLTDHTRTFGEALSRNKKKSTATAYQN
jgi:hypothetical protein